MHSSTMLAALAGLVGSICFGIASAWQHVAAESAPKIHGSVAQRIRVLVSIIRHPKWIAGGAFDVAGFGLQAYALTYGTIAVVQPLLVCGLLFSLVFASITGHQRLRRSELGWGVMLVTSLAVFLLVAVPGRGHSHVPQHLAIFAGCVALLVGGVAMLIARTGDDQRRALVLGSLTGFFYGYCAAITKMAGHDLTKGVDVLLSSWPFYALIVFGAIGFAVNQLAFQSGRLSTSLGAITSIDPIVSVILGVALFGEGIEAGPLHLTVEVAAVTGLLVATFRLSKSADVLQRASS